MQTRMIGNVDNNKTKMPVVSLRPPLQNLHSPPTKTYESEQILHIGPSYPFLHCNDN